MQTAEVATSETTRKILVVEDEEDIRTLVRYNLEAEGFEKNGVHGLSDP